MDFVRVKTVRNAHDDLRASAGDQSFIISVWIRSDEETFNRTPFPVTDCRLQFCGGANCYPVMLFEIRYSVLMLMCASDSMRCWSGCLLSGVRDWWID